MKPGTGLSLLIPLLLASILLGAGCIMPGEDPPEPDPGTPLGLLEAFEWCYDYQGQELYAELLDPDFVYILFPDQGDFDEDETPVEWGREEELAYFADFCDACGEGDIDLVLDVNDYEEPGPDDDEWPVTDVDYTLMANIGDITFLFDGHADFLTVKVEEEGRWRLLELRGFERPEPPF